MYLCKINNDISFWLSCRCNVSQVCAVSWNIQTGRFPDDFNELYHTPGVDVFTRHLKDVEGCVRYMIYKDPFIRMVDNYALLTTGKMCPHLKKYMQFHHGFYPDDSFDDFMEKIVRKEIKEYRQEGHFEPQSIITDRFDMDYMIKPEDLSSFFKEKGLPYRDFDYNECDDIEYEPYLKYRDEIYDLYSRDLEIPGLVRLWTPGL